jgi:hypothetical protein
LHLAIPVHVSDDWRACVWSRRAIPEASSVRLLEDRALNHLTPDADFLDEDALRGTTHVFELH